MTLPPEAGRWLAAPAPAGTRVAVAGVAGGVGTTTVTALLWWALRDHQPVGLLDHGGGTLAARLPAHTPPAAPRLVLHDVGPFALTPAPALQDPGQVLVVVCATAALDAAAEAVAALTRGPADARARAVLVPVAVAGRSPGPVRLLAEADALGLPCAVVPLGRHRALAAGGDVPGPGLDADVDRAHRTATALAAEVVRCARASVVMGRTPHAGGRSAAWS